MQMSGRIACLAQERAIFQTKRIVILRTAALAQAQTLRRACAAVGSCNVLQGSTASMQHSHGLQRAASKLRRGFALRRETKSWITGRRGVQDQEDAGQNHGSHHRSFRVRPAVYRRSQAGSCLKRVGRLLRRDALS